MENRWVKSQKLELSLPERQILFNFLETNYLPENRDYKYDFFYNNCVTKIWDVLFDVYGPKLAFDPNYLDKRYTHRQLIHQKVNVNSWLGFGIDLALGSVIDEIATPKEHMFLPDYTMLQLEHSTLASEPLAMDTEILFEARPVQERNTFFASPVFWLTVVLLIILVLTYRDFKNNTRRRWLDFIVFFGTGATGLLILFLWFFTDHTATAGNFNFLWAFPLNLIIAFIVGLKIGPNWIAKYVLFLATLLFSCTVLWLLNVQVFSPVAIPIWLALAVRYLFLYWSYKTPKLT
jgi:hypothetical protein